MNRAKAKSGGYESVTRMAFGLLLVLVAARATLVESVRTSIEVYPAAKGDTGGTAPWAGPTTSLLLDLLCMIPALLVLSRRVLEKDWRLRWSWSAVIFLGLGVWSAASVAWSADKFDAAIGAADFLAAGAIMWAAVQLVRSWRNFRLTAAVACGLLMVCLVKGFYGKYVEIPRNLANRSAIVAAAHMEGTGFGEEHFMDIAKELLGFYASPNSFASVLVMLMAVTLGLAIQRLREDGWGWFATLIVPVGAGMWVLEMTQCKAAVVTGGVALIIFAVVAMRRGSNLRWGYWAGVGMAAAGLGAGVVYGLHRGGLPTDSLNFRWRYWVGAMRVFGEHPILGVGWGGSNFYQHYVTDRLIRAAEDIRDPHNFFLRYLVELGTIGGVLAAAWLMRFWWEATRPNLTGATEANGNRRSVPFVLLAIAAAAAGIAAAADMDFGLPTFPFLAELSLRIMYVLVLTLGGTLAASRSLENPGVDDRPAPWVLYGVLAGLATMLVHNLIDFSLTEASVLCLFALLAGAAVGIRMGDEKARPGHRGAAIAVLSAAGAAWVIGAVVVYVPVLQSEALALQGDQCVRDSRMQQAEESFMEASKMTPWNWDYPYRAARALNWVITMQQSSDPHYAIPPELADKAIGDLDAAMKQDPLELGPLQLHAELLMDRRDSASKEQSLREYAELERLNPAGLEIRLEYAWKLAQMKRMTEAREQLKEVARINDQFDPKEPMRLSQMQLDYYSRMLDTAAKQP